MLEIIIKENNFWREQAKESIEILADLKKQYGKLLKSNIISVRLNQCPESYYLEMVYRKSQGNHKKIVERVNLNMVSTNNKPLFPLTNTFEQNLDIFNKHGYHILHLITPMFTKQGVEILLEQLD